MRKLLFLLMLIPFVSEGQAYDFPSTWNMRTNMNLIIQPLENQTASTTLTRVSGVYIRKKFYYHLTYSNLSADDSLNTIIADYYGDSHFAWKLDSALDMSVPQDSATYMATKSNVATKLTIPTGTTSQVLVGNGSVSNISALLPSLALSMIGSDLRATLNVASGPSVVSNDLTLPSAPARVPTSVTRALNSNFQSSTTKGADCSYSVLVSLVSTLLGSASATVYLEQSANGSTGWTFVDQSSLSLSGVASTQSNTQSVGGYIIAGYYVRIRTVTSATGIGTSAATTYQGGQETTYN